MQAAASLLPKLLLSSLQSQALPALSGAVRSKAHLAVTNVGSSTNIRWHEGAVCTQAKESLLDQRGAVVWFTGLSGSGKSTVACTLEHALAARGKLTANLDGDNIRHGLNSNLGFSPQDRAENIRRIGEVAKLFADSGMISLCSFISPYTADRDRVRARLQPGQFIEVYMRIPLSVCEARDPKGLYAKARAGKLKGMTGIDDPYEEPTNPELIIDAADPRTGLLRSPEAQAAQILAYLEDNNYLCANVPQMQAMG